jgi:outer membrane protein OmpA-like peptidoglycan-associated protein
LLWLAGCSRFPDHINPEVWWHELEGGPIAQARPPAPGADQPYPNLATVPPKPKPGDPVMRQRLSAALLSERSDAQYAAAQNPIRPPPRLSAPPPPASDPDASTASLEATQAPPSKPAPPASLTVRPSAATDQPAAPQDMPEAPPPPPVLAGISIGPTIPVAPVKAPPVPPPAPPTPSEAARAPVPIAFAAGSAVLPQGADGPLKLLAQRRANKPIDIIGFGEADDAQPAAQNAGVSLGLARARAVAVALMQAGVPANLLRIDAQAAGRGADARLVD